MTRKRLLRKLERKCDKLLLLTNKYSLWDSNRRDQRWLYACESYLAEILTLVDEAKGK